MRNLYIFICLLGLVLPQSASAQADLGAQVETFIRELETIPETGIAVSVVKDGKVLLNKGYGLRNRQARAPVTEQTLFPIASVTKTFTSFLVAMAAERGLVSWSNPIHSSLPSFALSDPNVTRQANLVDLLSHRSGVTRNDVLILFGGFSQDELFSRLPYLPMNPTEGKGFREGFQYNNLMFMAAGELLEARAGVPWQRLVATQILQPLGMTASLFSVEDMIRRPNYALPYAQNGKLVPYGQPNPIAPAGAMISNAVDMSKWLLCQLAGGRTPIGRSLVSPSSIAWLRAPRTPIVARDGTRISSGLGWFINEDPTSVQIWHGGNLAGFSSQFAFMPKENIGVAVMVNEQASAIPQKLANRILALLRNSTRGPFIFEPAPKLYRIEEMRRWAFSRPRKVFNPRISRQAMSGDYEDKGYGKICIGSNGAQSFLLFGKNRWVLKATGAPGEFVVEIPYAGDIIQYPVLAHSEGDQVVAIEIPFEPETPTKFRRTSGVRSPLIL